MGPISKTATQQLTKKKRSIPMNQWLADIYGTAGAEDIEKTAQAHMLAKLAQDEGIDLSQFSPEELEALAQQVLAANGGQIPGQPQQFAPAPALAAPQQPMAPAPGMIAPAGGLQAQAQMLSQETPAQDLASMQKEAAAKFEEADTLGRVMAHAYTDELEKIASAKTAALYGPFKGRGNEIASKAGHYGRRALGAAKDVLSGREAREGFHGMRGAQRGAAQAKGMAENKFKSPHIRQLAGEHAGKRMGQAAEHKKTMLRGAAKTVGAYGAAGVAAGAAHHAMNKEASAFEKMAYEQAADILSAVGINPATGVPFEAQPQMGEQQFQGAPEQQFQDALDERALQILADNGYDVDSIVSAISLGDEGQTGGADPRLGYEDGTNYGTSYDQGQGQGQNVGQDPTGGQGYPQQ